MKPKSTTVKTLVALLAVALGAALPAQASTFRVSNNGNTFTISRSGEGTNTAETVYYRAVGLTAYDGQHFVMPSSASPAVSVPISFYPGQTNRLVTVEERNPSNDAYKFQAGTTRTYRLEVIDEGGFLLDSCDRDMTTGTSIPSPPSASGTGMFAEKTLTIKSDETTVSDDGYINNPYLSMAGSAYYDSAAPKTWFQQIDAQLRMTLSMQVKEVNDGYQYIQLLFDNTSSCDDRSDCKDGNPGNISLSRYMAGFGHHPGSYDGNYATYTFPVLSAGDNCGNIDNPWNNSISAKLYDQKFRYAEYRGSDGKLIIPTAFNTLVLRLNASGDNQDNWTCKNVEARIQAFDTTAPTLIGVAVSPGPYHRGNPVAISLAFSEAVNPFFNQFGKLETTWGNLSKPDINYLSGKGGNVLTFTGKISDAKADGTALAITGFDSNTSLRDFARNEFIKSAVSSWSLSGYTIAPTTKNYSIAYDLAGGALPEGASNPATYNYDTPRFVLVNPVRLGCDFKGWSGTDISSTSTNVVVQRAHGDRFYKAVWTPIVYSIAYDGATNGVAGVSNPNPTSYTVEDDTISLVDPTRTGYTFDGWFADAARTVPAQTTFPASDLEPKTFYAVWTPITYTIHFDANGGIGEMDDIPMTYDVSAQLPRNAFALIGQTFTGWTGPGAAAYADGANVSNLSAEQGAVVTLSATWNNTDWANEGRSGDTEEDAYLIYTPWQLDLLATRVNGRNDYMGKFFRLMADLAYDPAAENNFCPIGKSGYVEGMYHDEPFAFNGTFDGNGHTISGVRVSYPDRNVQVGLFSTCGSSSVIKNLTLANAVIKSAELVGGIVCDTLGMVSNCFVVGTTIVATGGMYSSGVVVQCAPEESLVGNVYHDCVIVRNGGTNVTGIGIGHTPVSQPLSGDIPGGAEACYAIDAASGAVVASEADFAFPVFGVTNRYWKTGSAVRLEYTGTLAAGQLPVFSVNGEQFAGNVFEMPATNATVSVDVTDGHSWNAPVYAWADDYSAVTASVVCADCGATWLQVFAATPVVSRAATCNETGEMTWTAEVPENVFGFTTQAAVQAGVPAALGHEWVSTNWTWSADYSAASVELKCGRDHAHDTVVPAVVTLDGETRDVFTWKATAEYEGETFSDVEFQIREKYTVTVGDSDGGKLTVCFATSDGRLIQLDDIGLAPRYRGKSPAGEWVYLVPEQDDLVVVSASDSGESIPLLWDPKLCKSYFIMPAHEVTVSAVVRPSRSIYVDYSESYGVTGCVVRVNDVAIEEYDYWSAPPGWPVEIEFMVKDGWTGGSVIVQGYSDIFAGTNFCCAATGKGAGTFAATFAMPDYSIEARCCAVPSVSFQLGTNTVHLSESYSSEYRAYTPDESGWYRFRLFAEDSSHRLYFYAEDGSNMDHFGRWNEDERIYTVVVRLEAGETYLVDCYPGGSPNDEGENDLVVIDRCPALTLNEDIGICIYSVYVDGEEWLLGYDDIGIPVGAEVQVKYSLADTNILQGVEVKTASGDDVLFTLDDSDYINGYLRVSFAMPGETVVVTPDSEMDADLRLGKNDVPFYGGMPDYRFAPEESGWYRFRSDSAAAEKGEIDPRVGIYKANGDYVAYGDDISYDPETEMYNLNFCCKAFLVGGKVYCIDLGLYNYTDATNVIPVFVEKTAPHAITVENSGCGRVAVRDEEGDNELLAEAEAGREIRIYAEPMTDDYVLAKLTAVDAAGMNVELEYNDYDFSRSYWYFIMPATNVTVSAVFCSKYPKYLDGADDDVLYCYDYWAEEYGYDVYGTNETAFLLNVAPTSIVDNATPLKIVELGTTNMLVSESVSLRTLAMMMGYGEESMSCIRVVLASDVAELEQRSYFGYRYDICNGYLVLRIGSDLSAPMGEWLEAAWEMVFEDGRAVIAFPEMLLDMYRDYVAGETGNPVNGLFLSASISSKPADTTGLMYLIADATGGDVGDGGDEGDEEGNGDN